MATAFDPHFKSSYRSDIDGLRAVAVLLVVLFHLGLPVSGGYIGVDVFFVISGYLISATILTEMGNGTFSIVTFYERRIRRIFPALMAMLLVISAFGMRYLMPQQFEGYGHGMLDVLFSVSNVVFSRQAGYFQSASNSNLLLHTWSLAVEEQFYVVFPILLAVVRRWAPRQLKAIILGTAGVSFALAWVYVRRDPTAAFYYAPLRAWELLIGTIVSQSYLPRIQSQRMRHLASLSGILLILVPAFLYNASTSFPGPSALPPTLGAALLIAAGESGTSLVGSILSWRPIVFIGLISYSLYLWHWPILVLQQIEFFLSDRLDTTWQVQTLVFVVSLGAAIVSWRLIETPFRKGKFRPSRRRLFWVTGAAAVAIITLSRVLVWTGGLPSRLPAREARVASFVSGGDWRIHQCFLTPSDSIHDFQASTCLADDPSRQQYLLLGDSTAAHLYPGLLKVFPKINFAEAASAGCRPLLTRSLTSRTPPIHPPLGGLDLATNCVGLTDVIFHHYLLQHHPDAILLSATWSVADLADLAQTIDWIHQHGMRVIVFGSSRWYKRPLPTLLVASMREGNPTLLSNNFKTEERDLDRRMHVLATQQWHVEYVSPFDDLCSDQTSNRSPDSIELISGCPTYAEPGVPLLFDEDHLTDQGSVFFARSMRSHHQIP